MIKIFSSFLQSKNSIYLLLLIVIILVSFLFIQRNSMNHQMELKVQFIEQKNMLRNELDDILDEHEDLLDEYGQLSDELQEKDSLIQKQIMEINDLINVKQDLKEAMRKIKILKSISKRYIATIDSLLLINTRLANEKDSVIDANRNINWQNYKLNKENKELAETVTKGSVLEVAHLEVNAIKKKITGKEATTKQAKKTQKINVCFTVLGNSIAPAGLKSAYIQIIDHNGFLLQSNESFNTILLNDTVTCTYMTKFDYTNITMDHCFQWQRVNILLPGYYLINVIIDEKITAQTTLKLK